MPGRISLVEDEPDQREACADVLRRRGYEVDAYGSRKEALEGFKRSTPDLSILDVGLGTDKNGGFDLCRELLALSPEHPIIFLTTRVDEIDQVFGLELGAWDYLPKPVSFLVLAKKIENLLRLVDLRATPSAIDEVVTLGNLVLDQRRMEVSWKEAPLSLTLTEFRILEALASRPGMVATYNDLMEAAEQGVVNRNTVNTHIRNLRKKIQLVDPEFHHIANEYALGYRWIEK
jgi:two-component system OmpR family response regulator